MATPALKLDKPNEQTKPVRIKASAKAKLLARYYRLIDHKFAGTLTPAQANELEGLKSTFDALNAPAAETMKRRIAREMAEVDHAFDQIRGRIEPTRNELANAASGPKANTAGSI